MTKNKPKEALAGSMEIIHVRGVLTNLDDERNRKILQEAVGKKRAETIQQAMKYGEDLTHDPLTGLYNRLLMDEKWQEVSAFCVRYGWPLAIIILDLDGFKEINDIYGHEVGDVFLKVLGTTILELKRKSDVAIRWGGDEMLVIFPDTLEEGAEQFGMRVNERLSVRAREVFASDSRVSNLSLKPNLLQVSFGVAALDSREDISSWSLEDLFRIADENLYEQKKGGKE